MFKYTYNLKKCKSGLNPCVFFLNFIVIICNINPYKFLNMVEDGCFSAIGITHQGHIDGFPLFRCGTF